MKSKIFLILLFGLFTTTVFTQNRMRERPEPIDWTKTLDLTDDQFIQFMKIQEGFREDARAMRENAGVDRMGMMDAYKNLTDNRDKQIKTLLDKKQYKKYKKQVDKNRKQMRTRQGKRKGKGRMKGQGRRGQNE